MKNDKKLHNKIESVIGGHYEIAGYTSKRRLQAQLESGPVVNPSPDNSGCALGVRLHMRHTPHA